VPIRSFRSRALRRLYEDDDARGLRPDWADRIRRILFALDEAIHIDEMGRFPGWRLHPSKETGAGSGPCPCRETGALYSASRTAMHSTSILSTTTDPRRYRAMPMKAPPHPGILVREEVLRPLGITVTEAARALGVGRPALSALLNGRADVTPDMAIRIEKAFGPSMDHLLRMQCAYTIAQARRRAARISVRRYRPAA
jgi:addiction module HigA family antidote